MDLYVSCTERMQKDLFDFLHSDPNIRTNYPLFLRQELVDVFDWLCVAGVPDRDAIIAIYRSARSVFDGGLLDSCLFHFFLSRDQSSLYEVLKASSQLSD